MIDPIGGAARRLGQLGLQNVIGPRAAGQAAANASAGGASFGDSLKKALEQVSEQQEYATDTVNAFLRGEQVELHQVMAATEEAGIALEMLIEVRNKFAEAYRTVINMQS